MEYLKRWMLALFVPMAYMHSQYYSETQPMDLPKAAKVTNLHFYLHELRGTGANATAVIVAQDKDTTLAVSVIFDILRIGPEDDSEIIGDARGLSVPPTKPEDYVGILFLEFGFTKGKFNGSSFSVFSRNPVTDPVRELSVVGGRGQFRMATGFALIRNTYFSETKFIVEYKVTLIHY